VSGTGPLELLTTVGGIAVRRRKGESAFFFTAGMSIDADGAPRAYHPALPGRPSGAPPGLDDLRNAGRPGRWFGIVTDQQGQPIVQRQGDPAPGFYVSATSLTYRGSFGARDPKRYVDASTIPFFVLPAPALHAGHARLGDFGAVSNRHNGKLAFAVLADIGPKTRIGEGSIALAKELDIPDSPLTGGVAGGIVYVVFAGSGNGFARPLAQIRANGARLLKDFGGEARLQSVTP
jgi:Fungal chitosanase of glycosyl hydrolase group 75